ncbi:hypothetical protein CQA77_29375, partial [Klebsiella pneumoniae]
MPVRCWRRTPKARFLFIAAFREWFSPHLFAELRGCSDEQGQSP